MIASFAGGLGLSAMLMPAAPSLALMTFIGALGGTAGRCPDGATGRIVAPAKSRGRNGNLFYVVLCRLAVLPPIGGILRDASGVAGAALIFAGGLELAASGVLFLFRLSQRRSGPA